jgi:squalene/oxidosqualene cyclase-like protein
VHPRLARGFAYLRSAQTARGSWHGDYDGPLFLLPGYVFAHFVTRTALPERDELRATLRATQREDGGWGLHHDGPSSLFATTLSYVALRLLAVPASDPTAERALRLIHLRGGAGAVPSWGKYWLSILNLYDWDGVHPVPPEPWLGPRWMPAHPSTWWCYARTVYLPVSYLYGRRWQVPLEPILLSLRQELYAQPYEEIAFAQLRDRVDPGDRVAPPTPLARLVNGVLGQLAPLTPPVLRARALERVLDHIKHEQLFTDFLDIGPVSKTLDVVACWAAEPNSEHTRRSIAALPRYLFRCERGLTMQAYNSTELWDTSYVAIALAEANALDEHYELACAAHNFIDANQIRENCPDGQRYYRDRRRGGWAFSTKEQGWPVADCTALGVLAALALEPAARTPIGHGRLLEAVDLLLAMQNDDHGWSTCERRRGSPLLEWLNPSELFADVMVDHSHTEVTAAVLAGLAAAQARFGSAIGTRRAWRIRRALARGARFLRRHQRSDGSWEGRWGICFTYGTMFGVWGLREAGAAEDDPAVDRAARFLCSIQLCDGGWGEAARSCIERRSVPHPDGSQPVMTAWALLALLRAQPERYRKAISRGVQLLASRQLDDGDWPGAAMTGVFNRTCALNYRYYRNYFPLWALAMAGRRGFAMP